MRELGAFITVTLRLLLFCAFNSIVCPFSRCAKAACLIFFNLFYIFEEYLYHSPTC